MYETILVPTDGSDAAATAAQAAFALARRFGADIHAIHVVDAGTTDTSYGEEVVAAVEEAAAEVDVETTTAVVERDDATHQAIVEYAELCDAACIVMGTHGQKSLREQVLGSVAERTLRESPVPVITVHEDTVVTGEVDRLLVPTDGSAGANAAAAHAIEFAAATGTSLHTIHVVEISDLLGGEDDADILDAFEEAGQQAVEAVIEAARDADLSGVEASVVSGVSYQAIEAYVQEKDIDYVFMGTHGRTGVSQQLLGSTTERVVRLLDVPVVSVRSSMNGDNRS